MNESIAQIGQQLRGIWKQLGLNQRVTVVVAAVAVLAGLGALTFWSSRVDYTLLYGRLDEAEAAKVIAALDEAKIPYTTGRGGGAIMVPADKVYTVRMQLASKGIPRGEGVGFEIFDKPNFGISDFVQRANYVRAVQGELARTIAQVDAVDSARVMIVIPETRLVVEGQRKPTASVFVRVRGNSVLPSQTVNAIRFLVANAVEGLQANSVTVVDNQGNVLSENNENDTLAGLTTTQLGARRNLEQYMAKKAEDMLDKVLGPGQSVVRVSAEINFDSLQRTEEKFDPDGQVVRTATVNDENTDTTSATANGGAPGTSTNSADTNRVALTPLNKSTLRKKVTNNQYEINKTMSTLVQTAGGLKRLSAAVFVAAQMTGTGTNRVAAPRSAEEMQRLRRVVQGALGIQDSADGLRKDEVTIEEMPFNDQVAQEMTRQFDQQQTRQFWWDTARNALYPVLALAIIGLFWRTLKKTPMESIPLGLPVGDYRVGANGNGNGHANGNGRTNGNGNGNGYRTGDGGLQVVTVDVLNQLIRENPDNMTQAIRTWMTRGKKN